MNPLTIVVITDLLIYVTLCLGIGGMSFRGYTMKKYIMFTKDNFWEKLTFYKN